MTHAEHRVVAECAASESNLAEKWRRDIRSEIAWAAVSIAGVVFSALSATHALVVVWATLVVGFATLAFASWLLAKTAECHAEVYRALAERPVRELGACRCGEKERL